MASRDLRAKVRERITVLEEDVRIIMADLDSKRRRGDKHGVRDACVDAEIAEARIEELRRLFE